MRDPLGQVRTAERHSIEEAQRADGLVQRRPRYPARDKVHLKGTHVLQVKPLRRAFEELAELGNRIDIRSLRCRREIADRHVLDHAAAQWADLGHRRLLPGLGCSTQTLADRLIPAPQR